MTICLVGVQENHRIEVVFHCVKRPDWTGGISTPVKGRTRRLPAISAPRMYERCRLVAGLKQSLLRKHTGSLSNTVNLH